MPFGPPKSESMVHALNTKCLWLEQARPGNRNLKFEVTYSTLKRFKEKTNHGHNIVTNTGNSSEPLSDYAVHLYENPPRDLYRPVVPGTGCLLELPGEFLQNTVAWASCQTN